MKTLKHAARVVVNKDVYWPIYWTVTGADVRAVSVAVHLAAHLTIERAVLSTVNRTALHAVSGVTSTVSGLGPVPPALWRA